MQASNDTNNSHSKLPFVLVENISQQDEGPTDAAHRSCWDFQVGTNAKTVRLSLTANTDRACLSDLVPVAHQLCDIINRIAIENESENGRCISCRKGCTSCCSYMVSLSSAEAFYLQKHILSLPSEKRKPILHSFLRAARKIAANKIPSISNPSMDESESLKSISNWYQTLNIKCPFMENDACSEYNARPLVCREHMVTSPAKACSPSSSMMTNIVDLPVSTAEVLMHVSNQLESTQDEAVILPLAMVWCNSNAHRGNQKYPTALLAEELIQAVSKKAHAMA